LIVATENVLFIGGVADGRREDVDTFKNTLTFNAVVERPRIPEADLPVDLKLPVQSQQYRRFWITRTLSVFVENSIDGDQVLQMLIDRYQRGEIHNQIAGVSALMQDDLSTVRRNMLTRKNYTPYCGNGSGNCAMPRTMFDGFQFQCQCGWRSSFEPAFIARYIEFNRAGAQ
jgi:hypothetical protein